MLAHLKTRSRALNYFNYTNKVVSVKLPRIYDNIKCILLTLTFMTGPWGAQEGIGEGGRGSFLKVGVPLDRPSSYLMKTTQEDYSRGRKQDHNVIKTACIGETWYRKENNTHWKIQINFESTFKNRREPSDKIVSVHLAWFLLSISKCKVLF